MILRCTAKLQALVGRPDPAADLPPADEDDWYGNLLWIDGRKCLLITHAATLFSIFAPDVRAGQLRPIGPFVVPLIKEQLAAEGLPTDVLGIPADDNVQIAKTADRVVLGCMNDQAFLCERVIHLAGGLTRLDLAELHRALQRNILSSRDYVPAIELVGRRL